jgi:Flavin containing amine oxidoreductase
MFFRTIQNVRIGGGISGIYTGWRLATAKPEASSKLRSWAGARKGKLKVGVFEGSQRIGGRLLSAQPPGMPNVICEIGGMRYVSSQTYIRSLIENELKLPRHEQTVDVPQNLAYLRGTYLRNSEMQTPSQIPYQLDWNEAQWLAAPGGDPTGLIAWSLTKILPEIATLTGTELEQFLQSAVVDGIPLYHHGFWNLLSRVMSSEAYMLCRTMVGYDCLGDNGNAVESDNLLFRFHPRRALLFARSRLRGSAVVAGEALRRRRRRSRARPLAGGV